MYESDYIWFLKFKNKVLKSQVDSYINGNKFREVKADYESLLKKKDIENKKLKQELAKAHAETVTVRKHWSEIFDDLDKERKIALLKAQVEAKREMERALRAERKVDELFDKLKAERLEKYKLGEEVEELKALVKKLTAQVNKDFENSSIPSSMQGAARKKITNSREKTGKKRGGQPGHKGHCRKKHNPDKCIKLEDPKEFLENPDLYKTGNVIKKQLVELFLCTRVTEYTADVWRSKTTKRRYHAPFPQGVINDVNYGDSVKALAFIMQSDCNVSGPKTRRFLYETTNGKVDISIGMLNGLCEEFSSKSTQERSAIIEDLMTSPTMNADFTNTNVNGNNKQVLILASESKKRTLFIPRHSKGHKGIAGTPLENYVGTVIHDHDTTFYSYGTKHQECHQHNIRYTKNSIENEPELTWNVKMLELIRRMLHYKNGLDGADPDKQIVSDFEKEYDEVLDLADKEYFENPPSDYYTDGINLCKRLRKYKESELRFLHDKNVSANNSLCERNARVFKRKQKQAMVFRDFECLIWLCNSMSIVYSMRQNGENIYEGIREIFNRKREYKKSKKNEGAAKG